MDLYEKIMRAAAVDSTALILSQSGTARKLVAQMLHQNGPRKKGPFVTVNCAVVPARLIESELYGLMRGGLTGYAGSFVVADGGTLLIDEIDHLPLEFHAALLRVVETSTLTSLGGHSSRQINVRVVSATSRDIGTMVRDGRFREDLYYRLNVVTIDIRDRPDDD